MPNGASAIMPIQAQNKDMGRLGETGGLTFKVMVSAHDSSSAESSSSEGEKAVTSRISEAEDESPKSVEGVDAFTFKPTGMKSQTARRFAAPGQSVAPVLKQVNVKVPRERMDESRRPDHKASLGNGAITEFREEDLLNDLRNNIKPYQNRLLLLLHAASCKLDSRSCKLPHECVAFKQVLRHVLCCHDDECLFPECRVSKILLNHFQRCSLQHCRLCTNLRKTFEKSTRASSPSDHTHHHHHHAHSSTAPCPSQEKYLQLAEICRQQEERIKKLGAVNRVLLQELITRNSGQGAAAWGKRDAAPAAAAAGPDERCSHASGRRTEQNARDLGACDKAAAAGEEKKEQEGAASKDFTFTVNALKKTLETKAAPATSNGSTSSSSQGYKRAGSDEESSLPMKKRFRAFVGVEA